MSTKELTLRIRENFFEVRNDRTLELKFSEVQLDMLWISIKKEYKQISKAAIKILLQFCTTYIVALSSIEPNIEQLCSLKQAQISH